MREYIENIARFMIISTFALMITGERFRRDIGFIAGLMLLAVICAPLSDIRVKKISPINTRPAETREYGAMREKLIINGIKTSLETEIQKQTGADEVRVSIGEENAVESVTLYGADEGARRKTAELCGIDMGKVIVENGR